MVRLRDYFPEEYGGELDEYLSEDEQGEGEEEEEEELQVPQNRLPPDTRDTSHILVVDNVPVAPRAKLAKLQQFMLVKMLAKYGVRDVGDIFMPCVADGRAEGETEQEAQQQQQQQSDSDMSAGFCFVKFPNPELAAVALQELNGHALDKRHTVEVTPYAAVDVLARLPPQFELPPFTPVPDTLGWLSDPKSRDQFVMRFHTETHIMWASSNGAPLLLYGGDREKAEGKTWCDHAAVWSPQGTYLLTFHRPGVALWGGNDFEKFARFPHMEVNRAVFSPCERYLITCSNNAEHPMIVWNVAARPELGEQPFVRPFGLKNPLEVNFMAEARCPDPRAGPANPDRMREVQGRIIAADHQAGVWTVRSTQNEDVPVERDFIRALQTPNALRWSGTGSFLGRLDADKISVFAMPSARLLDSKSLPARNIHSFAWSPAPDEDRLAYWTMSSGNTPAGVTIVQLPGREEICRRNLFNVSDGVLHWHNRGDYLCVHMLRTVKKVRSHVLIVFRLREPSIPVEQIEIGQPVMGFAWEPDGHRFAVVHGEYREPRVTIYSMFEDPGTTPVDPALASTLTDAATAAAAAAGTPGAAAAVAASAAAAGGAAGAAAGVPGTAPGAGATPGAVPLGGRPVASAGAQGAAGGAGAGAAGAARPGQRRKIICVVKSFLHRSCNKVSWSPAGGILALETYSNDSSNFELYNVDTDTNSGSKSQSFGKALLWDPSGRMVAAVAWKAAGMKVAVDTGYMLFSFQGDLIHHEAIHDMYGWSWRPRPSLLLTRKQQNKIKKNVHKYEKQFEKQDIESRGARDAALERKRKEQARDFFEIWNAREEEYREEHEELVTIRDGYDSDDDELFEITTEVAEEQVERKEEPVD